MVSVVVLFTPPTPSAGKMTDVRDTKSHAPAPCTSIWELRRSDGTAYPHQQLSAAAAVLNAAPSEYDLDEGEDTLFVPPSEVTRPNTESIVQSDGDGSASDNRMDPRDRVTGGGPNDPAADSPSSASVGMGLAGGLGEESPEKAVKGRGAGTWGLLSLFVLTLAGTALTIAKAMLWRRSTSRDKSVRGVYPNRSLGDVFDVGVGPCRVPFFPVMSFHFCQLFCLHSGVGVATSLILIAQLVGGARGGEEMFVCCACVCGSTIVFGCQSYSQGKHLALPPFKSDFPKQEVE